MKLTFNKIMALFIFLNIENVSARDLILIENLADFEAGNNLNKIIQEKFNIPKKLITQKNLNHNCNQKSEAILHLCLRENGELEIISMNKNAIESILGIFLEAKTEGDKQ